MSLTTSAHWMYNPGGGFYGYEIDGSLRFEDGDNAFLSRTPGSSGNRQTWTVSFWVKFADIGNEDYLFSTAGGSDETWLRINSGGTLQFQTQGGSNTNKTTSAVYRDPSAWYHIVIKFDSTQGTAENRQTLYINGIQQTWSGSNANLNESTTWNHTNGHKIGERNSNGSGEFSGYIADFYNIDGQALDASYFGETKSGIWIPKAYSGSYGTNGFHLEFGDSAAIGDDTSGNTNDWTVTNLVASDVVLDSPTNNFAVVPSTTLPSTGYSQHTEGNLQLYQPSWGGWDINIANFNLPSSGKYYWEVMPVQGIFNYGYGGFVFGIGNIRGRENISGYPTFGNPLIQVDSRGIGEYRQYPAWVDYTKSGSFGFTVGSTVYGIAVDCDAKKFWFSLNNSWAGTSGTTLTAGTGDPANGTNGDPISGDITDYVPFFNVGDQQSSCKLGINFGQDSTFAGARAAGGNADENGYGDFVYAPPSGFLALCSANLPTGAINTLDDETPEDYFNTVLYTGTGATQSITGVGFQPDWVWLKRRSASANHTTLDAVRGATKTLEPNVANAEETQTQSITSFDSDGWTIGSRLQDNGSGFTYVSWNWLAGNGTSSNTDGSITTTVSVGATSQQNWFSIVKYTGNASGTIGHGLGVTPDFFIIKNLDQSYNWNAWHNNFTGRQVIYPNLTNARNDDPNVWNNTLPTSTVISVDNVEVNNNGDEHIAYCFANAEGLCKVGSYTGNGSADGTFIYTGFRPAWILIKNASASTDWMLQDNRRLGYNVDNNDLVLNQSYAEATDDRLDQLSNGFKLRSTFGTSNTSGQTYIYLAIAEQPFKYANAR